MFCGLFLWLAASFSVAHAQTIPNAPTNLLANAVFAGQINLSWSDTSTNEDGFLIERAADSGGVPGAWTQIGTVSSNVRAYSDAGLPTSTTYWYRVRAFNAGGNSDYSNQAMATNLPMPPAAPSNLIATPLSSSLISLSWTDNSTNETNFAIERTPPYNYTATGEWYQVGWVTSNVTTYTDGSYLITTNRVYWYRVRASNAGGYSPYSNEARAIALPNLPDSWSDPVSGKWETGGSWSLTVPPSPYLLGILVTNAGSKTVTIDAATVGNYPGTMTITNLTVSAASGETNTLLLTTGGSPTPLHVSQGITLGSGGLLDVENSSLWVDQTPASETATIDGTLLFQNGGQMLFSSGTSKFANRVMVGRMASGQMMVAAGTVLASEIDVGYSSQGTLTVSGTATVRCYSVSSGPFPSGTGTVWVTGGQLIVTNRLPIGLSSVMYVGYWGAGQMTVSNGMVLANRAYVGYSSGACGTLTVAGGSMTISTTLSVGSWSTGTGAVWVTGGQLMITNGSTAVGDSGSGRMTVTGGSVQALSMMVGQTGNSQGSLVISGGTATVSSSLVVGDCATNANGQVTIVSGGSLYVTNASHTAILDVHNGTLLVDNGGLLVADTIVGTNGCGRIIHTNGGTIIATTLVLDPALSAVGDSIPNGWKQQYGFDPFDPSVANEDTDGDGMSNLQESLAGTDPTNSTVYFHITSVMRTGNDLAITWTMGAGKTNALQVTAGSNFGTNNYTDIFIVTNAVGTTTNYLDVGGVTNTPSRYYRVRLVP